MFRSVPNGTNGISARRLGCRYAPLCAISMNRRGILVMYPNFIRNNWSLIAAVSHIANEYHGPGAIAIVGYEQGHEKAVYLPAGEFERHPALEPYASVVWDYNPEEEVVVVFRDDEGRVQVRAIGAGKRLRPGEAHARMNDVEQLLTAAICNAANIGDLIEAGLLAAEPQAA